MAEWFVTAGKGILSEQVAYYRARASEYDREARDALANPGGDELERAFAAFRPRGDVLELACGTGLWTERLVGQAASLTAVDASPEMIAIASQRVGKQSAVRFIEADLFEWRPDRTYDTVFFGFWLSHVPPERFASFWALVADCLAPGGHVFFIDDALRTSDELIEGEDSATIRRRLKGGSAFRIVKVPYTAAALEERLTRLGWDIEVHGTSGPFYWGRGQRS